MSRSGKTSLAPVISSFDRVEHFKARATYDRYLMMYESGDLTKQGFKYLFESDLLMDTWFSMMGRDVNRNLHDLTSVMNSPKRKSYLAREEKKDTHNTFNEILEEIEIVDYLSNGDYIKLIRPAVKLSLASKFSIVGPGRDRRASTNPAMQLLDYMTSRRYGKDLDITDGSTTSAVDLDSQTETVIQPLKDSSASLENLEDLSGEEELYMRALELFDRGQINLAEQRFSEFIESYPTSIKLAAALFWRAETRVKDENWIGAANDYLESFTINPDGETAAKTLFGLGVSLGAIGEKEQACLTLDEVGSRFENIERTLLVEIVKAKNLLNCDQPR